MHANPARHIVWLFPSLPNIDFPRAPPPRLEHAAAMLTNALSANEVGCAFHRRGKPDDMWKAESEKRKEHQQKENKSRIEQLEILLLDECLCQQKNTLLPFVLVNEQYKQDKQLFCNKLVGASPC